MTAETTTEPIIDPELPIIDAHHHLWFLPDAALASMTEADNIGARSLAPMYRRNQRYLFDEYLNDIRSGHNIRASIFVQAYAMYRSYGPEDMKSVGEVEFVNGAAAMAASGVFGDQRICAGIVGGVDLRMGHEVERVLEAHIRAGGDRYRGVRSMAVHDDDSTILGRGTEAHVLADPKFREGFSRLHPLGLSFDTFLLEPQLPDLVELARHFPETQIILNHAGAPVGVGRHSDRRQERFSVWRKSIQELARLPNVAVKLGGLGIPFCGFDSFESTPRATSKQLSDDWRPYIETCIDAFGVDRCMFESNFPVDSATASYPILWNAFKRIVESATTSEKAALFAGTAARIYRLESNEVAIES